MPDSADETAFGEQLVAEGICTRAQLDERLRRLRELAARGVSPLPRLGELLAPSADTARGKYVLRRRLGEGAMGEVWLAWDPELRRTVALKLLKARDREEFDAALRAQPGSVDVLLHRGTLLRDQGELEASLADLEEPFAAPPRIRNAFTPEASRAG